MHSEDGDERYHFRDNSGRAAICAGVLYFTFLTEEATMKTYTVTNHNGTILGIFLNIKLAYREQLEYRSQTGNMAYIEDTESRGRDGQ